MSRKTFDRLIGGVLLAVGLGIAFNGVFSHHGIAGHAAAAITGVTIALVGLALVLFPAYPEK